MFSKKIFIFFFLISILSFSQELPPIEKYSPLSYNAGNQNWMISQGKNQFIYFANNDGLLEFNGSSWNLYSSSNETIIRSVKVIQDKIYTGCYMEFGYWIRQSNGQLKYTSLSKKIKNQLLEDEQFWNILSYEQFILFQSLNRIYIYDSKNETYKIIAPQRGILKSFANSNGIYYQTYDEGLYEIENGKSKLISKDSQIVKSNIVNVFSNEDELIIPTQSNGIYKYQFGQLSKFNTQIDSELTSSGVFSCLKLANGGFVIGTISKGVFVIDKNGQLLYSISQKDGLTNNTVLSLFEDSDNNIWLGLDNGINCLNLQSAVRSFSDNSGKLGTVYTSIVFKNNLYIGTNQGLFYKNYKSNQEFKFISGTKGQVWSLFTYDGTLFCGHNMGTFIINDGTAKNIYNLSGTWKFSPISNHKNFLLQGNYNGISVLQKVGSNWIFKNRINGFDYSSRYFEIAKTNEIYVSHEYKGVFNFKPDAQFSKANQIKVLDYPKKGNKSSLIKYNNSIYYAYKEGVYKLNEITKKFEKHKSLSAIFSNDNYTSGKLIADGANKIWLFSKNNIHYFSPSKVSGELKQNVIPIPSSLSNAMLGYENITLLSNSEYLIGTTDGYYIINLNHLSFKDYKLAVSNVYVNKQNEKGSNVSINQEGEFSHNENNITISYAVQEYNKYLSTEYQYLLEGFQDQWSEWTSKPSVTFKNLPPNDYVFKVRAKIANTISESKVYTFKVSKPWYITNLAIFIYLILSVIGGYFINKLYIDYYAKQREKLIEENNLLLEIAALENEKQIMKLKNEELSHDVDAKNKELAVSTMSLIQKNELLALIKDDLKKTSDDGNKEIKSVISTINKNISEDDSWNVFKEAFDNADKDFLKKVKNLHPSLTPNDLRLCAYLRLNFSSKEIAPLLNISVRSVEIKRYRLRKKMDLSHEKGLVEYILSI